MRPALLHALLAPALLLTACGKDSDTRVITGENGEKVTIQTTGNGDGATRMHATNEKGDSVTIDSAGAVWPADAPGYAAAYPGATLVSSVSSTADGKTGNMLVFETADAPATVVDHYKTLARDAGLGETGSMAGGGTMMFTAADPATGRELMVQANNVDGRTQGSIAFTAKARG